MKQPPRNIKSKLLTWKMLVRSYGVIGPMETAASYIIFFMILFKGGWTWGNELAINSPLYMGAVSGFFAMIVFGQIFNLLSCRTRRKSIFNKGFFKNNTVFIGIIVELVLLFFVIFTPLFNMIFSTQPFSLEYIPLMLIMGLGILFVEELRKFLYRKYGVLGVD